jgi:polysaccharide export outer membrane protein
MKLLKFVIFFLLVVLGLSQQSCRNRALLFKAPENYKFSKLSEADKSKEYRVGINDILQITMLPNNGNIMYEMIGDMSGVGSSGGGGGGRMMMRGMQGGQSSVVEYDGTIKLPTLGRIYVNNLTIRELELLLEETFKKYFNEPFVTVTATNRRVLVFPGRAGGAQVLQLINPNTSLIEAIATVGGVPGTGKSDKIILIRDTNTPNQKVFRIDLSKLSNLDQADLILQANDIIYIEPRNDYLLNLVTRASPYIGVLNLFLITNRLLQLNLF